MYACMCVCVCVCVLQITSWEAQSENSNGCSLCTYAAADNTPEHMQSTELTADYNAPYHAKAFVLYIKPNFNDF